MVQTTSAELADPAMDDRILCCYSNGGDRPQVLRLRNIPQSSFAAIVFPRQRYLFTAAVTAILEIYPSTPSDLPVQHVSCRQLRVKESPPLG